MVDMIVEAIRTGQISANDISFTRIKEFADCGRECWAQLGRGRAILSSPEQLDQYLRSYGPMTKSQWEYFLSNVTIPEGCVRIVDYGCGQGLASALLFDRFGPNLVGRVKEIVLIEPSSIALTRAQAILECYCKNAAIFTLNKTLDELTAEDLRSNGELNHLHLFSNVLDIDGFQHFNLFTKIFKYKGQHSVLAVSHNRNFHGGATRFRELERAVSDPKHRNWLTTSESVIEEFQWSKWSKEKSAISWQLHLEVLEVLDGSF